MKLYRHTSHENDNITTHKWQQFVPDDVECDNIYVMNEFICILDEIIDILPHIPSDLQLHPVKLKCKLEYKSHYMYDMICRDHVISAITWLKAHNSHYRDIKLNEQWYSDIGSREYSVQLDECDNHMTINEDKVHNQSLKTADNSKEKQNRYDNQQLCTA